MKKPLSLLTFLAITAAYGCGNDGYSGPGFDYILTPGGSPTASPTGGPQLRIFPGNAELLIGRSAAFGVNATLSDGSVVNVSAQANFQAGDDDRVRFEAQTARTLSRGTTTVTAQVLGQSVSTNVTVAANRLFASDFVENRINVYDPGATGDVAPLRSLGGGASGLSAPWGLKVYGGELLVANNNGEAGVSVFSQGASGGAAPLRTFTDSSGTLPVACNLEVARGEVFLSSQSDQVSVYALNATGAVAPLRRIQGAATGLVRSHGLAVAGAELFVGDEFTGEVRVFARSADGNATPLRVLAGANTGLGQVLGLTVVGPELFVSSCDLDTGDYSVRVFPVDAQGDVAPTRVIEGSNAGLEYADSPVDYAGELLLANYYAGNLVAFPLGASGNQAPARTIEGPGTELESPLGLTLGSDE